MAMQTPSRPTPAPEMVPKPLLWAILALVLASLALVSFASLTNRAPVGVPKAAAIVAALEHDAASGKTFNLAGEVRLSARDYVATLAALATRATLTLRATGAAHAGPVPDEALARA